MQDDAAAFEGWILCLKSVLDQRRIPYTFTLDWQRTPYQGGHYQRFLYRVMKFNKLFGGEAGWFKIKHQDWLLGLKISEDANDVYFLNAPSSAKARLNDADDSIENFLENQIVKQQDAENALKEMFQMSSISRQLPVGLYRESVKKANAIFTGGKSAVDLWGIRESETDDDELVLFELKAKGNRKVGVLSELFFYAMVLRDEQEKRFLRKKFVNADLSPDGKCIQDTKLLQAIVLAPEIHPLITRDVFDLINRALDSQGIRFGFVKMDYEMVPKFSFGRIWG